VHILMIEMMSSQIINATVFILCSEKKVHALEKRVNNFKGCCLVQIFHNYSYVSLTYLWIRLRTSAYLSNRNNKLPDK
jgi:hypothetical protein